MWNNRPPNFPSHEALEDMGEDRNRRRRPNSPWGPIIVFVIIVAVIVILLTRHQTTSRNTHGFSNNTASVTTHSPELSIKQPLIPGTSAKVSGWAAPGTGVEIRLNGPTSGVSVGSIGTQSNGYFFGTILVPDDMPMGTATIQLFSGQQLLLKETVKVVNPYKP